MTNEEWAKTLKRNTQVIMKTFNALELELLNFGFVIDGNTLHCLVEISSDYNDPDIEEFEIKLNLYDEQGDIFKVLEESAYEFVGYDTFDLKMYNFSPAIQNTIKSARLYVKKE